MKIDRRNAACSVFEGKIDVTGGNTVNREVEAYDYHENKWTFLGKMQKLRYSNSSVSMGNKLFVIGGYNMIRRGYYDSSLELFDSIDRKFTLIKCNANFPTFDDYIQGACCIGSKILIVCASLDNRYEFTVYDDEIKDFVSLPETNSTE